jgi:ABC-type Na+ efflux pump permease subunit
METKKVRIMNNVIIEIGEKELKTTFKSKSVILPMLLAIGIPLFALIPQLSKAVAQGGAEGVYLILFMLLLIPTVITSLVGMNAFLNEIKWKTIKSLLVAPVSEKEIFIGKSLACIIPGLIVEACLAGIILVFLPMAIDIPILITLLVIGPLLIMFATFLIIAATSRFPGSAEGGAAVFIPVGGIMGIFLLCFFLQRLLQIGPILTNIMIALVIGILAFVTYFIAAKWFNRERLVVGL